MTDGIELGELETNPEEMNTTEEASASSPFMNKFMLWDKILSEMSNDISVMMEELVVEPEISEGMEMFPEGSASLTIEASLYSYNLIKSSRELKQCLMGAYRALEELKKVKNGNT